MKRSSPPTLCFQVPFFPILILLTHLLPGFRSHAEAAVPRVAAVPSLTEEKQGGDSSLQVQGHSPIEWSEFLADSEIRRLGNSLEYGGSDPQARWDYSPAVFALSLMRLGEYTGDRKYIDYGLRAVASHVDGEGRIRGYRPADYNLDSINPGKVLLASIARGEGGKSWKTAVRTLRSQMGGQPRTSEGGFWHKKKYPDQMWLDGLYMASPFLAQYAVMFHEPSLLDEVARQIILMDRHAYDSATGLHHHGWDEKRVQHWADAGTGCSPSFWSRSIGWYLMAIVDTLDFLPPEHPERREILSILNRVADGIVRYQDPASGVWWQVIDRQSKRGNYPESSASSMFVYGLAKAVNKGYLPRERFLPAITRGYEGLIRSFVRESPGAAVSLTSVCKSAGLGSAMDNGRPRDGTFDYYVSEPAVENDPKGTGAFILAGLEVQRLTAPAVLGSVPSTVSGNRTVLRDLEYGRSGNEPLLLDLHLPPHNEGKALPVVLLIHGGGWTGGDKGGTDKPGSGADISPLFAELDRSPFLWCSMNYRLAPAHRWPACLEDVGTAIRWLKLHVPEYGGDPSHIALIGHSAGGHLALLAGEMPDKECTVQAIVGIAPVSDHEQDLQQRGGLSPSLQSLLGLPKEATPFSLAQLREISPIHHIGSGMPPVLIIHGDADRTVPLIQSRQFQEKAVAAGVRCDLMIIPDGQHRLADLEQKDPGYPSRMMEWLKSHL
jgi:rhamnogalacturonyl hydrolase YesR/acetyl esterase/lipase